MKKVIIILILGFNLILLKSCAKPTVLNVTLPNDNELNCEKLEDALGDAQAFRKKAMKETGSTLDNQLRGVFFWPALSVKMFFRLSYYDLWFFCLKFIF